MSQLKTKFISDSAVTGAKIADGAVDNNKLSDMAALSIKGNDTGSSAPAQDLTVSEVNALLGVDAIAADVADLVTLSGVAANSTTLGTFSGTIIPDSSDIKEALQSLETYMGALPDPFFYAGTYNASTNSPALANTDTNKNGYVYYVSVAGSQDFGAGSISFDIGDKVVNNGSTWDKWDMTDAVTSVNSQTGAVVLVTDDIAEDGSPVNLWFTDARAQAASISQVITNGVTTKAPSEDAVFDALALKAPLASPALTGTPTAPTASPGTNTTQLATTAFVAALGNLKANVTLDNLGTTSINNDLLFDSDLTYTIGSSTERLVSVFAQNLNAGTVPLNLRGSQISIQNLASDPGTASAGDIYYNSASNKLRSYNGSVWSDITPAAVTAPIATEEHPTLVAGDITNQYIDLLHTATGSSASVNSISLSVVGGLEQLKGVDYTVSLAGGAGGVTRITFAGDLATAGAAALIAGDILMIKYSY